MGYIITCNECGPGLPEVKMVEDICCICNEKKLVKVEVSDTPEVLKWSLTMDRKARSRADSEG